jgi:hypothetical protein
MHLASVTVVSFLAGCASVAGHSPPSSVAHGATLSLVRSTGRNPTFELRNSASSPLAYNHWFSMGPAPVAYCRGVDGHIRFCSLRVMLTEDDQPYIHESYIQPGKAVRFQADPSRGEQIGVRLWVKGREEDLWLDDWAPNTAFERARDR